MENTRDKEVKVPVFGSTGFQPVNEFRIYRKNLPHWEGPGSVYFITFRTAMDIIKNTAKYSLACWGDESSFCYKTKNVT